MEMAKVRSVLNYNGLPIDARSITDQVLVHEGLRPPIPASMRHRAGGAAPASGAED